MGDGGNGPRPKTPPKTKFLWGTTKMGPHKKGPGGKGAGGGSGFGDEAGGGGGREPGLWPPHGGYRGGPAPRQRAKEKKTLAKGDQGPVGGRFQEGGGWGGAGVEPGW